LEEAMDLSSDRLLMNESWGNPPYSIHIFRLQKKVIRIITSTRNRESCRSWFKRLKILPLQSQYIYLILSFVIDNMNQFTSNFINKRDRI
jgi:hypothetical protein